VTHHKVRFVVKSYEQIYGQDFTRTTATARLESFRVLLHIAAACDWDAQQLDVKTALLNGILPDDEIQFMEQPEGFHKPGKESWVWELHKGLYGMRQSGCIWNKQMHENMILWGFTCLPC
jgi:Reverse transcriptase (RNA-dependent DNA polymerase)